MMSLQISRWEDLNSLPTAPVPANKSQNTFERGAIDSTIARISERRAVFDPMYLIQAYSLVCQFLSADWIVSGLPWGRSEDRRFQTHLIVALSGDIELAP